MQPIPYSKQEITEDDIQAVKEVLQSDFLTQGPKVAEFEKKFAQYVGARYAVAVSNGTAALHLSVKALQGEKKTKIITTPITFSASANCIRYCDCTVDFADISPDTLLIDTEKIYRLLKSAPKGTYSGIIPVDFAGYPVNMEVIRNIADEFGLWIVEDACHAPGAWFTDSKGVRQQCGNGNYANLTVFSFHPVKHIATGEGGMITTNDETLYKKLLLLRTHGITKDPEMMHENHGGWYMEMQELGYNYRMSDIQAALGISQLNKADKRLMRRIEIAHRYNEAFKNSSIKTIIPQDYLQHAYHLYVIQVEKRKEFYDYLRANNIYSQVHYIPVHLMPYYKKLGWKKGDLPVAEKYYEQCLSLPMYPSLTDEQQQYVIEKIKLFYH
ncbi:MAG: UDP-4-amino-4,6-dideoxy-N-acetyl-beta-L-altrosamine transaminase [Cytophagaceae bacterium]|nr:UDP-4-amino-4,6-dideoxy-N-acetyl-beta-L-altrosamine transaminase [Cytophagaceae bacterium]MDW8456501.1 UDP-4-amino-4,6-dideoxy-N-acetyl-beta-L-altrosamine transaminase [Cytophagaceae bacterium]